MISCYDKIIMHISPMNNQTPIRCFHRPITAINRQGVWQRWVAHSRQRKYETQRHQNKGVCHQNRFWVNGQKLKLHEIYFETCIDIIRVLGCVTIAIPSQ